MIEIAKSCNVPFTPDANIMREDEVLAAEAMLIDFQNQGQVCLFNICQSAAQSETTIHRSFFYL